MQLALTTEGLTDALHKRGWDCLSFLKYAANLAADGIEISGETRMNKLEPILAETGLEISSYRLQNSLVQPQGLNCIKEELLQVAEYKVKAVRVSEGNNDPMLVEEEKLTATLRNLEQVLVWAEQLEITLYLENQGSSSHLFREVFSRIPSPYLEHSFHMANYFLQGEDPRVALGRLVSWVGQVRAGDLRLDLQSGEGFEQAFQGVVFGLGYLPVAEMMKQLQASDYSGWIVVESTESEEAFFSIEASLKNIRQFTVKNIDEGRAMRPSREMGEMKWT